MPTTQRATFNSREGFPFNPSSFVGGCLSSGICTSSQAAPLAAQLKQYSVENVTVERVGSTVWVTLLTKRGAVVTWRIGGRGKLTMLDVDVSEVQIGGL